MVEVSKDGTAAVPHEYKLLSDMIDMDIGLHGSFHSSMVRAGLMRQLIDRLAALQAERDRYRVLANEAFEFLGGVDGAIEIRARLMSALSDTPTVQS